MRDDLEARRNARASWPIRRLRLGEETSDLISGRTPSELVSMVQQLTLDAWAMTGAPVPQYSRQGMPGRVIRRAGAENLADAAALRPGALTVA